MSNLFAISNLSFVPIRANSAHSSEMVSQILYGETVEVLEKKGEWVYIKTNYDNYLGWVDEKQLTYIDVNNFEKPTVVLKDIFIKNKNGKNFVLPAGANLSLEEDLSLTYPYKNEKIVFENDILSIAKSFLDTTYLWGGRTHLGIDCSGFAQIVYKIFGIKILRDASQQVTQGEVVAFLSEAKTGDLAFFENEQGKVTHVGIMINNNEIIHASGRVKIDSIDDEGIFSKEMQKYTHKLRIVKRYI